jgi:hypothetical protein
MEKNHSNGRNIHHTEGVLGGGEGSVVGVGMGDGFTGMFILFYEWIFLWENNPV